MLTFRTGMYSNVQLIYDENGRIISVRFNQGGTDERTYLLGDRVKVTPDARGVICPGIKNGGFGTITEFTETFTDHFFGVKMDGTGESGFCKEARIRVIPRTSR